MLFTKHTIGMSKRDDDVVMRKEKKIRKNKFYWKVECVNNTVWFVKINKYLIVNNIHMSEIRSEAGDSSVAETYIASDFRIFDALFSAFYKF